MAKPPKEKSERSIGLPLVKQTSIKYINTIPCQNNITDNKIFLNNQYMVCVQNLKLNNYVKSSPTFGRQLHCAQNFKQNI